MHVLKKAFKTWSKKWKFYFKYDWTNWTNAKIAEAVKKFSSIYELDWVTFYQRGRATNVIPPDGLQHRLNREMGCAMLRNAIIEIIARSNVGVKRLDLFMPIPFRRPAQVANGAVDNDQRAATEQMVWRFKPLVISSRTTRWYVALCNSSFHIFSWNYMLLADSQAFKKWRKLFL